ncbi:MAG TPA: HNH endonuclease signature motif containing protein, partial [Pyrinomonadaceae bacterium]
SPSRKNASEFLYNGSTISSHKLKLKLLRDEIKERICEKCKNDEWMGQTIPLELHHVNGNRFDNRLANLQLLCPNCHALTDNYSGRKTHKN